MMRHPLPALAAVACVLLACATPYQRLGEAGGYLDARIAEDEYEVTFFGNGATRQERAFDFALLRAADIGRRLGFTHLAILAHGDASRTTTTDSGSTTTTTGKVDDDGRFRSTTKTENHETSVTKPGVVLRVRYFVGAPAERYLDVREVDQVVRELVSAYELDGV